MKKIILTAIMLVLGLSTSLAQKPGDYIKERIRNNFPIFSFTPCTPFLLEFGSSAEAIIRKASEIGIKYHSKLKLPVPEGGYILAFYDLDNLRTEQGSHMTETIVYMLSFTKKDEYFSFSMRITCGNIYYSKSFYDILVEQVNKTYGYTKSTSGGTLSLCEDRGSLMFGKKMNAVVKLDESPSATLTIIDLTILEQAILTK
jgi:hypothetical protein